jgi:hypothetical protein
MILNSQNKIQIYWLLKQVVHIITTRTSEFLRKAYILFFTNEIIERLYMLLDAHT